MMATPSSPMNAAVTIRAVGAFDIMLGIAMALFGESVVPLGEFAAGFQLWWLIGGLLVVSGIGALIMSMVVGRRARPTDPGNDPVRR